MIYQIGKWALFALAFANVAGALYANGIALLRAPHKAWLRGWQSAAS